jgi:hypothetical protein
LVTLALLAGCYENPPGRCGVTGGGGPVPDYVVIRPEPGGSADPDGGPVQNLTIMGNVSYDRLSVTASGLDLLSPVSEPAVNVLVEAVPYDDVYTPMATAVTDGSGDYSISFSTNLDYFIRARAETGSGSDVDRVYHSASYPVVVHSAASPILNRSAGNQTVNIHAAADAENRAGAFAVLDTVRRLRAAAAGSFPSLGPLDVFWSNGNAGTQFLKNGSGQVITMTTVTGLDGPRGNPSIYLIGGTPADPANSDHDEYDETIIAHEWASFLQLTQSRDNNFGGVHFGEELIPSASFSEGVVTAIGLALLGTSVYRDTVGYVGGTSSLAFEFDMESGVLPGSGTGYGNEFAIRGAEDARRAIRSDLDGQPDAATGRRQFSQRRRCQHNRRRVRRGVPAHGGGQLPGAADGGRRGAAGQSGRLVRRGSQPDSRPAGKQRLAHRAGRCSKCDHRCGEYHGRL